MNLQDYQRTLIRLSFAAEAQAEDFVGFGDAKRFLMYRNMVRSRLSGMAKQAFRGCHEMLGDAAFEAAFSRYLAERPPRSPLIREAVPDFAPTLQAAFEADRTLPAFGPDLARFEEAKWRVSYQEPHAGGEGRGPEVHELSFERAPLFNPVLRCLKLSHAVHEREGRSCAAKELRLLLYRPKGSDEIRWYPAHPLFAEIFLGSLAAHQAPLSELVRASAQRIGSLLDEALLETLATEVTLALQRGVLLGSRGVEV